MKKREPTLSIVKNVNVGDQRVRDLERQTSRLTSAMNEIMGGEDWDLDDEEIEFVEELPENPDPDVVYAVYDDMPVNTSLSVPIIFVTSIPHPTAIRPGILYAVYEQVDD